MATIVEIAAAGAARAEAEGFGPCEQTFGIVLDMISPEQAAALGTATIDAGQVDDSTPGQVEVPVEAIVADVAFTEQDLGDTTLRHQDGDWFIVD